MAKWGTVLPLLLVAALFAFEEWVSVPSCEVAGGGREGMGEKRHREAGDGSGSGPGDLKVMMVADLLLLGPGDGGVADVYFRDSYTTKFLRKSFEKLKPDMLVVLGDISAKGSSLTKGKWLGLLRQFQRMLGPFLGLPLHVVLGDRDVGDCEEMDIDSISQIASKLPGLDSAGCGGFEISNISFLSLNAVAMLCGNNKVRFHVETAIERESFDLRYQEIAIKHVTINTHKETTKFDGFHRRENHASSGSGPVLLLHFPLFQTGMLNYWEANVIDRNIYLNYQGTNEMVKKTDDRDNVYTTPYGLAQTLPLNATEYIFQALKPSIVFSAHSHHFLDKIHRDGTREVTVPAMTWAARDDPGFVVATFNENKSVIVTRCFLARESHVVTVYLSFFPVILATILLMNRS